MEECVDLSGLFFGSCDMVLGVGYADGSCQYISGCGWVVDGVDYSGAFFESMDECEEACASGDMTCEEIESLYDMLHTGEYATCEFDNDCMAVWANSAWGTYWSWDPKETWSLITWLIYAGFLHCRFMRGWRGKRAAWISIIGFASVLFTYVGVNFLLSGLHSYAK